MISHINAHQDPSACLYQAIAEALEVMPNDRRLVSVSSRSFGGRITDVVIEMDNGRTLSAFTGLTIEELDESIREFERCLWIGGAARSVPRPSRCGTGPVPATRMSPLLI